MIRNQGVGCKKHLKINLDYYLKIASILVDLFYFSEKVPFTFKKFSWITLNVSYRGAPFKHLYDYSQSDDCFIKKNKIA